MIVISDDLVLSTPPGIDLNAPVIGWRTVLTAGNVSASFANVNFPVTNVANPSTYLKWKSTSALVQHVTVTFGAPATVDYLAIAGHNFGTGQIAAKVEGATATDTTQKVLLHFDGVDASTTATDSNVGGSAHTWAAAGNAQLDTADKKFGTASGLFDGSGDFWSTSDSADYTLGTSAVTIDAWFKCTAVGGTTRAIAGQSDNAFTGASSWTLRRSSGNVMEFVMAGGVTLTGTTQFTNLLNTGWHHVAVTRSGNTFRLFVDGVQEATATSAASFVDSALSLFVGERAPAADPWQGWIDDFRLLNGRAAWTANFVPSGAPHDQWNWQLLGDEQVSADDSPIVWRFAPVTLMAVRLTMDPNVVFPEVAVAYTGELLELQRHIYVGHRVMKYNRRSNVVTGFSDEATFLGRIVLGEFKETSLDLQNITASFYRAEMDPWVIDAVERPFFFAWRPTDYPLEVGFGWMTADVQMSNQRPNGMVRVAASIRGIA